MKVGGNVQCSTYAEILDLKLALDIYFILEKAGIEVKKYVSDSFAPKRCGDIWLKQFSFGNELISSVFKHCLLINGAT